MYTLAHIPFHFHICICQLKSNITFEMLQKTKSIPAFKQIRMHQRNNDKTENIYRQLILFFEFDQCWNYQRPTLITIKTK